jgi:superfamily II DNA or RNA helicase
MSCPYKRYIIKKIIFFNKRAIIQHGTGSGKSFTIYLTINYLLRKNPNHKILILVPKIDLVTQFYEDIIKYGNTLGTVGKFYGEEKNIKENATPLLNLEIHDI